MGYIYIYIYILEDGFKDLNKVNPKAAESLEIVAIWKKKKRKEDGFNIVSLIYIYNSSFGPPCVIYELSHGSRYYSWRWPSCVHWSYIIKF